MHHDILGRLLSWLACAAALLALAACSNDYPADWPPIARPWFGSCPDLTGTYDVSGGNPFEPPDAATPARFKAPWQLLKIASRGSGNLELTWTRSADAGALAAGQDPAARWSPAHRGLGEALYLAALGVPPQALARELGDTRAALRCSHGVMVLERGKQIARDTAGNLVMMAGEQRVAVDEIPLWCGDGCRGIPLGRSSRHAWHRWALSTVPAPLPGGRRDDRFEAPGWHDVARWRGRAEGEGAWRDVLVPLLPEGVRLAGLQTSGNRAAATLAGGDVDALASALHAIDESHAFDAVEVAWFSGRAAKPTLLGVLLTREDVLRLVRGAASTSLPAASAAAPSQADLLAVVRMDVEAALPAGVQVETLTQSPLPNGSAFVLRVRSARDRAAGELMAALWKYHYDGVKCLSTCSPGYPAGGYEIGFERRR